MQQQLKKAIHNDYKTYIYTNFSFYLFSVSTNTSKYYFQKFRSPSKDSVLKLTLRLNFFWLIAGNKQKQSSGGVLRRRCS